MGIRFYVIATSQRVRQLAPYLYPRSTPFGREAWSNSNVGITEVFKGVRQHRNVRFIIVYPIAILKIPLVAPSAIYYYCRRT